MTPPGAPRHAALTALYVLTLLLAAMLLFLVQPMAARMLLPSYGGSPSVWTTCMLFFQVVLLAGYCGAHALARSFTLRWQVVLQIVASCAALAVLPFRPEALAAPADLQAPVRALLGSLLTTVGPPLLVLSATAPLLQRWFSHAGSPNPYVLYSASNLGSLAALLGYPFVVEPLLPMGVGGGLFSQTRLWAIGYGAFVLAAATTGAATAWLSPSVGAPNARTAPGAHDTDPAWRTRLLWLGLAFIPSSAMLGVTLTLTTDVAAVPLLWIVPLSLYLVTYVIAFSGVRLVPRRAARIAAFVLCLAVALLPFYRYRPHPAAAMAIHLAAFFFLAVVLHGDLWRARPHQDRLTEFYLWIAAGGALGGVFNALIAPAIFDAVLEYPIVLTAGCLLAARSKVIGGAAVVALAGCFVAAALLAGAPGRQIHAERTFFGVVRVMRDEGLSFVFLDEAGGQKGKEIRIPGHIMLHGTTRHGIQLQDPVLRHHATSYYHLSGPIGGVFRAFAGSSRINDIGVVGLGTGTLAAYGQKGQRLTFFEIDPAVARIAQDPAWFTYLAESRATVDVQIADGRVGLTNGPRHRFDLLIVDGFTSDAIPVHLLTREAFDVYLGALRQGGMLAFHVTSKYFNLIPVVGTIARSLGLKGLMWSDYRISDRERVEGKNTSDWVVLSLSPETLAPVRAQTPDWKPLEAVAADARYLWTDDYASPLSVMRW